MLLLAGWVAAELPPVVPTAQLSPPDLWRRTRDGWERAEWLIPKAKPTPYWLHPALLATFEVAVSIAGFQTLSRRTPRQ